MQLNWGWWRRVRFSMRRKDEEHFRDGHGFGRQVAEVRDCAQLHEARDVEMRHECVKLHEALPADGLGWRSRDWTYVAARAELAAQLAQQLQHALIQHGAAPRGAIPHDAQSQHDVKFYVKTYELAEARDGDCQNYFHG